MNKKFNTEHIASIEKIISYNFKNKDYLETSFTHSSFDQNKNYEKLEFLGDSLINFFSTIYIYKNYTSQKVGKQSIKRTQIINNDLLSSIIIHLKLNKYILVGKNVTQNTKITSDVFESLSAAIYLDSNIETLFKFLENTLLKHKNLFSKIDYKGKLISYMHTKSNKNYKFNTKLDTLKKNYETQIIIDDIIIQGYGNNKKKAEQNASKKALEHLNN